MDVYEFIVRQTNTYSTKSDTYSKGMNIFDPKSDSNSEYIISHLSKIENYTLHT